MVQAPDWSSAAAPDRRIGRAVEVHDSIGSTNDRARQALGEPGGEGLAIVAEHQAAGRGRRGRSWLSPTGVNLMVSVAFRTDVEPSRAGLLGIAAALAVRDACATAAPGVPFGVRWPNDIVAAGGQKVAGLLVETTLVAEAVSDAVIGIGINVNWPRAEMPAEIRGSATSLCDLVGSPVDRVALLADLLARLDGEAAMLEAGASPVERFRIASVLDGREVTVEAGDERLAGVVAGIAEDGALLLDSTHGRIALSVGEVVAVRDAPAGSRS